MARCVLKIWKRLFCFSPPEVSVVSNPSLRYQKAAEESSAERKKVSIAPQLKAVLINQPCKNTQAITHPDRTTLISFSLSASRLNEVFCSSRLTC